MTQTLRVVAAQLNLTVGDIQGNLTKHLQAAAIARDTLNADIIVFPELSLTGYPPEDLLLRPAFLQASHTALTTLIADVRDIYCVVSHPSLTAQGLFNACSVIYNGNTLAQYAKHALPNYGVFDECRYFIPGKTPCVVPIRGIPVGIVICEDLWCTAPTQLAKDQGAQLILSPNASPFELNKHEQRQSVLSTLATSLQIPIIYVNLVGGQDSLTFDGGSMAIRADGALTHFAGFFKEALMPVDFPLKPQPFHVTTSPTERVYHSLVLALRDYVQKNRFQRVILGLSGGIDSALTLAIAVDALGADKVRAILMPSRHTSTISMEDAHFMAQQLGVAEDTLSIESTYQALLETLAPRLNEPHPAMVEENLQSRCRALLLMALSNQSGALVLTTGNRSEMAVGYCTIYGDMAGGFAILKDIPKTMVFDLARFRNTQGTVIPTRTLERPPSAELAPGQKDEDSLPPYAILDAILEAHLDHSLSIEEIIAQGFNRDIVTQVIALVRQSEYKRSQAAIGPRIRQKSFGKDWRYPVTNAFLEK